MRALTHCAATKVESNVFFVQPFPRERLSTCPCRILSSFSEKVCGLLVQRINSTSERVNTLDKYVLCVASFLRTFRDASSFTLLFFIFHLLNREFIISLNKKTGIICNPRVSRCIKIFNPFLSRIISILLKFRRIF